MVGVVDCCCWGLNSSCQTWKCHCSHTPPPNQLIAVGLQHWKNKRCHNQYGLPPQLHSFPRLEYSVLFSGKMTNMRVGLKFVIWAVSCKIATGQSKHIIISIKPVSSGSNMDCTNRPFQKAVSVLWLRSSQHLTDVLRQNQRNDSTKSKPVLNQCRLTKLKLYAILWSALGADCRFESICQFILVL